MLVEANQYVQNMKLKGNQKRISDGTSADVDVIVVYKECRKNHAASIGGYAVDGCCEFMAAGGDGTGAELRCAACNCHRNFHRKVVLESETCSDCSSVSISAAK